MEKLQALLAQCQSMITTYKEVPDDDLDYYQKKELSEAGTETREVEVVLELMLTEIEQRNQDENDAWPPAVEIVKEIDRRVPIARDELLATIPHHYVGGKIMYDDGKQPDPMPQLLEIGRSIFADVNWYLNETSDERPPSQGAADAAGRPRRPADAGSVAGDVDGAAGAVDATTSAAVGVTGDAAGEVGAAGDDAAAVDVAVASAAAVRAADAGEGGRAPRGAIVRVWTMFDGLRVHGAFMERLLVHKWNECEHRAKEEAGCAKWAETFPENTAYNAVQARSNWMMTEDAKAEAALWEKHNRLEIVQAEHLMAQYFDDSNKDKDIAKVAMEARENKRRRREPSNRARVVQDPRRPAQRRARGHGVRDGRAVRGAESGQHGADHCADAAVRPGGFGRGGVGRGRTAEDMVAAEKEVGDEEAEKFAGRFPEKTEFTAVKAKMDPNTPAEIKIGARAWAARNKLVYKKAENLVASQLEREDRDKAEKFLVLRKTLADKVHMHEIKSGNKDDKADGADSKEDKAEEPSGAKPEVATPPPRAPRRRRGRRGWRRRRRTAASHRGGGDRDQGRGAVQGGGGRPAR